MSNQHNDSLLTFPCRFPIKAMGLDSDSFESLVVCIVNKHAPDFDRTSVERRSSQGGKYLSITITILATSRAQLDAIYQDLTDCEQVLVAL